MDRLNEHVKQAAAKGWLDQQNQEAQRDERARAGAAARMDIALDQARRLAAQLAPIFPIIASQTKSEDGLQTWCESWARQILAAKLSEREMSTGLAGITTVLIAAGNPPLSFSHFLIACRPNGHMTGSDHEARQKHPLLALPRDLKKDEKWCAARDQALSKLARFLKP